MISNKFILESKLITTDKFVTFMVIYMNKKFDYFKTDFFVLLMEDLLTERQGTQTMA